MRWIVLAALTLFVIQTALKALRAPWQVDDFPEALAVKVELLPWLFPLHMVTGGLVLLLIPATLLVRKRARWHRPLGRITAPTMVLCTSAAEVGERAVMDLIAAAIPGAVRATMACPRRPHTSAPVEFSTQILEFFCH